MAVTVSRTRHLLYFAQQRNCLPYAYGGAFSTDTSVSTDCSGLVFSAAAILIGANPHQRYGSTETLRLARLNRVAAPNGLIPARSIDDVPRDASLKVGVQHGGGGPDSHTACTFLTDGVFHNWESRGDPGVILDTCRNARARAWNDPLFHDFWYLPAANLLDNPDFFPLPPGYYYGPQDGPNESISGLSGEPNAWIVGLRKWQRAVGAMGDGTWHPDTAKKAREVQQKANRPVTGFVDQATWDLVIRPNRIDPMTALTEAEWREILEGVRYLRGQMGPKHPDWSPDSSLGKNAKGEELTLRDGIAQMKREVEKG